MIGPPALTIDYRGIDRGIIRSDANSDCAYPDLNNEKLAILPSDPRESASRELRLIKTPTRSRSMGIRRIGNQVLNWLAGRWNAFGHDFRQLARSVCSDRSYFGIREAVSVAGHSNDGRGPRQRRRAQRSRD